MKQIILYILLGSSLLGNGFLLFLYSRLFKQAKELIEIVNQALNREKELHEKVNKLFSIQRTLRGKIENLRK